MYKTLAVLETFKRIFTQFKLNFFMLEKNLRVLAECEEQ
jgi:hypothetical protein